MIYEAAEVLSKTEGVGCDSRSKTLVVIERDELFMCILSLHQCSDWGRGIQHLELAGASCDRQLLKTTVALALVE
jgi:hypothetical protein